MVVVKEQRGSSQSSQQSWSVVTGSPILGGADCYSE